MRSRLLLPVPHLPTIRETSEELSHGAPGQEPPASPSLDDYVRCICQLAQPTSVLDKVTAWSRPNRSCQPAWTREKRRQAEPLGADSSPCFSSLQPTLPPPGNDNPLLPPPGTDNPLDWLFGKSQEQQTDKRDHSDHRGVHRQMGKDSGRPCEARVPEYSLGRKPGHRHPTPNRKSCSSRKPRPALASAPSSRPSSILGTLYLHLPVIHEL